MKNIKFFTVILLTFIFSTFISCNSGLTNNIDQEKQQVSIWLELEGRMLNQTGARTIGIPSVGDVLQGFNFTVNLVNTDDSTQNATKNGDISQVSSYLYCLSLSKGNWKINISGTKEDADVAISGSTSFKVGATDKYFVLNLEITGDEPGSIEFELVGKPTSKPTVKLYTMEKYLSVDPQSLDSLECDLEFNNNTSEDFFYALPMENEISNSRYRINGIPKGQYFLSAVAGTVSTSDVVNVYPGLVSKGSNNLGKYKLVLDLQCGNQGDLTDIEVGIEDGIFPLPGYGSSSDRPELVRPGYLFTGWYDTPEAAALGFAPSVPLESKYISLDVPGKENTFLLANRTLYAGWKPVNTDGLLEQDIYFWTSSDSNKVIFKDKLKNNPRIDSSLPKLAVGSTSDSVYAVSGDDVYMIEYGELYYFDSSSLREDATGNDSSHKVNLTWSEKEGVIQPDSNPPPSSKALYKDSSGRVYLMQTAQFYVNEVYAKKFYIFTLNKNENPLPYATLDIDDENIEFNYSNKTIQAFAVYDNKLFLAYEESGNIYLEKYHLQAVTDNSQEKLADFEYVLEKDGETVNLTTLYNPYPLFYNEGEPTGYAKIYVSDICVDGNSVYLIVDENSYTYNSYGKEEFISTGAVVEFNTNLVLQGIYGRQVEPAYLQDSNTNGNSHFVSHAYDMTAFAGPKKLLAIYKRKLVIFDEGGYPYYMDDSESPSVKVKRWLSRVTTFDLDKKCIDYTQITNMDILQGSTIAELDISGFSWDNI